MKLRATVGEVSYAIEKASERYKAPINFADGVYKDNYNNKDELHKILEQINFISKIIGENPKILLSKIGQDGHDRGIKVVASAYKDFGFNVTIGQLFQTPQEVVDQAIKNNIHIIGISTLTGGHKTLIAQLIQILEEHNKKNIIVVVGGVIPPCDYDFLNNIGISSIFIPGTTLIDSANRIISILKEKYL